MANTKRDENSKFKKKNIKPNGTGVSGLVDAPTAPTDDVDDQGVPKKNTTSRAAKRPDAKRPDKDVKQKHRQPFTLDEALNTISFNRQPLNELKGSDLMSKWRNSDVYKGTNLIQGINRWAEITPQAVAGSRGARRVLASDIREAQRLQSAAKSKDYQLRQQASKERADAFYELWKQNNREARVKQVTDEAKKGLQNKGMEQVDKPVMMNGIPADQIPGTVAHEQRQKAVDGFIAYQKEKANPPSPNSPSADPVLNPFQIGPLGVLDNHGIKLPGSDNTTPNNTTPNNTTPNNTTPNKPEDDTKNRGPITFGPFGSYFFGPNTADKGGYSSLGSDGKYRRFSLRADYKGGSSAPPMKAARRAALSDKYLDKDGNVTKERQAEIDKEMSKGGTHIYVNGVKLDRNQISSGNIYTSTNKTGAGGRPRTRSQLGREVSPGTIEFNEAAERHNSVARRWEGDAKQWQDKWKRLDKGAKNIGGELRGSLGTEVYVVDQSTRKRLSPEEIWARKIQQAVAANAKNKSTGSDGWFGRGLSQAGGWFGRGLSQAGGWLSRGLARIGRGFRSNDVDVAALRKQLPNPIKYDDVNRASEADFADPAILDEARYNAVPRIRARPQPDSKFRVRVR